MEISLIVYPKDTGIDLYDIRKNLENCPNLIDYGVILNLTEPAATAHICNTPGEPKVLHILVPSAGKLISNLTGRLFEYFKNNRDNFLITLIKKDGEQIEIPSEIPNDKLELLLNSIEIRKPDLNSIIIFLK